MGDELKPAPCPFCGEMLEHRKPSMTSGLAWWEHPDNECVLAAIQIGDALIVFDEPEAIAAWNRRADARDAERYRWLRKDFSPMGLNIDGNHAWAYRRNIALKGPTLDAAIDAATEKP
jgi:hypothetical protein